MIPFYTTELVIALSLSYVLYVSGDMDREGRQSEYISHEGDSRQNIVLVRKGEDGKLIPISKEEQDELKDKLILHENLETDEDEEQMRRMSNNNINRSIDTTIDGKGINASRNSM